MTPSKIVFKGSGHGDKAHQLVSSYFIGPHAENLHDLKQNIDSILNQLRDARLNYHPDDPVFITESVRNSPTFRAAKERVEKAVTTAANLLGKHSLPFWSARYQAHMCMDLSMPALLGYFMTMIYNRYNLRRQVTPPKSISVFGPE
ncbi:uncharacterized protein LY89DRAFT_466208 [Mollisia scopiformis]|uniref:Uncharacterized protein n=1 Tax=Mollisia scopiformis TaxID=149040 RepID=A0A194XIG8_MOLSC|nr:uncharacterized protein LY89DRAFT_466208 [Mollisia scopiformis]KUJ19919.1 hypothetical protein LY89DRAFT_466208 [Mollisia scopiformis]